MPRVLIIERTRHPRSSKKTFKQTIEFVSARSLPRRLKTLQKMAREQSFKEAF